MALAPAGGRLASFLPVLVRIAGGSPASFLLVLVRIAPLNLSVVLLPHVVAHMVAGLDSFSVPEVKNPSLHTVQAVNRLPVKPFHTFSTFLV
jgi:hypothetical protein